jgi:hypothetical protein
VPRQEGFRARSVGAGDDCGKDNGFSMNSAETSKNLRVEVQYTEGFHKAPRTWEHKPMIIHYTDFADGALVNFFFKSR